MRESWALIRASWLSAASYRLSMATSLASLVVFVLPLYFVSHALQPAVQQTIASEANEYFGFVVIGAVCFSLVSASLSSLPSAIDNAVGHGTLEVILGTPARIGAVCAGLMGYNVLWTLARTLLILVAATWLGAHFVWRAAPIGLAVIFLIMLSYAGLGLMFAASILVFRTTGPLTTAILTGSMLLGGVYYPTEVIPSGIREIAAIFPLTFGLRALRRLVLIGDSFSTVAGDVGVLALMSTALLIVGTATFGAAMRRARRLGTLSAG